MDVAYTFDGQLYRNIIRTIIIIIIITSRCAKLYNSDYGNWRARVRRGRRLIIRTAKVFERNMRFLSKVSLTYDTHAHFTYVKIVRQPYGRRGALSRNAARRKLPPNLTYTAVVLAYRWPADDLTYSNVYDAGCSVTADRMIFALRFSAKTVLVVRTICRRSFSRSRAVDDARVSTLKPHKRHATNTVFFTNKTYAPAEWRYSRFRRFVKRPYPNGSSA